VRRWAAGAAVALLAAGSAAARDTATPAKRGRVALGPQVGPAFPGSDKVFLSPYVDYSTARDEAPFAYEASDESAGFTLLRAGAVSAGPAANLQNSRGRRDLGVDLPRVGLSVELGGFVQLYADRPFRLRAEVRKAVSGHKGWAGAISADHVWRDADRWLVSLGPRVTLADRRFNGAYFDVTPAASATSGLRTYRAGGGVQALGAALAGQRALGGPWGLVGYVRYDRLTGDAADSPIARGPGSRHQLSGGVAVSYTFARR